MPARGMEIQLFREFTLCAWNLRTHTHAHDTYRFAQCSAHRFIWEVAHSPTAADPSPALFCRLVGSLVRHTHLRLTRACRRAQFYTIKAFRLLAALHHTSFALIRLSSSPPPSLAVSSATGLLHFASSLSIPLPAFTLPAGWGTDWRWNGNPREGGRWMKDIPQFTAPSWWPTTNRFTVDASGIRTAEGGGLRVEIHEGYTSLEAGEKVALVFLRFTSVTNRAAMIDQLVDWSILIWQLFWLLISCLSHF